MAKENFLMQMLVTWMGRCHALVHWLYSTVFRGSLWISSLFFLVSAVTFFMLNHWAESQKSIRFGFEEDFRRWKQKGVTAPLSSAHLQQLQQWNLSLGKRFNGRLSQEISRDHPLFRETPYRLNGSLLVDYKELESLIGIFSLSDNGVQNGSILLTRFTIKRLGEDSRVSYGFISRSVI